MDGTRHDVVVIGAGLAGLTAAAFAARDGASVLVLEARSEPGGRARTTDHDGFLFNQGAHAVFRNGAAAAVLKDLGVRYRAHTPRQRGAMWIRGDQLTSVVRPAAFGGVAGVRALLPLLRRSTADRARGRTMAEWIDDHVEDERGRQLVEAAVRIVTYSADPAHLDAGAAMDQLRRGVRNVLYVDGGWRTLVDGLRRAALAAGAQFVHERVDAIETDGSTVTVCTAGGEHRAGAVIAAVGGATNVDTLLDGASAAVHGWAQEARPVRAATFDVALRRLPDPRHTSSYGLGEPTYAVVHSASARLAPPDGALVHCLYYEPDLHPEVDHRARLEAVLDLLQPGWREELVEARFNRQLVVAHDRPSPGTAAEGPGIRTDLPGVFVAGDWITSKGLLADAATSSGREAGRAAAVAARGGIGAQGTVVAAPKAAVAR